MKNAISFPVRARDPQEGWPFVLFRNPTLSAADLAALRLVSKASVIRVILAAGPNPLIPPAMQHSKQPFWAQLQLLMRLTLNGCGGGPDPKLGAKIELIEAGATMPPSG